MSGWFSRVLDAYRVLTGQDDLVRQNILKMQRDFAQREARRAKQQAALEKQILKELRESAKALKTIKEGYVEQEKELTKFAVALGETAQAQLAAQAQAEAALVVETARRSGIELQAPPPFSDFVKQAGLGLASGEAASVMLGELRRGQGAGLASQEAGRTGAESAEVKAPRWEVGNDPSDQSLGSEPAVDRKGAERVQGFSLDAAQVVGQGSEAGLGQSELGGKISNAQEEEVPMGSVPVNEGVGETVPLSTGKVEAEAGFDSEPASDQDVRSKEQVVSADPEKKLNELGIFGEGRRARGDATPQEVEVGEHPGGVAREKGTEAAAGDQEEPSHVSKPWAEVVDNNGAGTTRGKGGDEMASFIELPGEESSGTGTVVGVSGVVLATAGSSPEGPAARLAESAERSLPPLESEAPNFVSTHELGSDSKPEAAEGTRKRTGKKSSDEEPKDEKRPQASKVRKKRGPAKKKAES